ncbi:hypothetical protein C8Q80DRAFT_1265515 [Daedaleopsis nitida]|nr:hypothetical protein C8Q80DRAFT_1265515 [Daedaleopsis nitida]
MELPLAWIAEVLSPKEGLSEVHELWLVNIPSALPRFAAIVETILALEAPHPQRGTPRWSATVTPDLSALPPFRSSVHCPSLKTLPIVCGFGDYDDAFKPVARVVSDGEMPGVPRLDLSRVLDQLKSDSAYSTYLEHIIIQVTHQVAVDEDELKALERFFATVRFEYVDELPSMLLPEYCVEPEMNTSQKWRGMLWRNAQLNDKKDLC